MVKEFYLNLKHGPSISCQYSISIFTRILQSKSGKPGEPFHPDKTFELKSGSCRDLSWMEIHLLRNMGIASRFVSGYFYLPLEKEGFDLHAWVEVFIPGAGWIGFDPSHGMVAGASHIPVASSAHYDNTMAVTGAVRGSASSELETKLWIEAL